MTRSLAWVLPFLLGCGELPRPPMSPQATSALAPVPTAPPPGRVERVPPQPAHADAWIDGEWTWRHGRWYWLLGRWVTAPIGATYSPWVVVRATDGTAYWAPSVWRDARGEAISPPPGLAFAIASGEAVVSPEGDPEPTGRVIETPPRVKESTPVPVHPPGE